MKFREFQPSSPVLVSWLDGVEGKRGLAAMFIVSSWVAEWERRRIVGDPSNNKSGESAK